MRASFTSAFEAADQKSGATLVPEVAGDDDALVSKLHGLSLHLPANGMGERTELRDRFVPIKTVKQVKPARMKQQASKPTGGVYLYTGVQKRRIPLVRQYRRAPTAGGVKKKKLDPPMSLEETNKLEKFLLKCEALQRMQTSCYAAYVVQAKAIDEQMAQLGKMQRECHTDYVLQAEVIEGMQQEHNDTRVWPKRR